MQDATETPALTIEHLRWLRRCSIRQAAIPALIESDLRIYALLERRPDGRLQPSAKGQRYLSIWPVPNDPDADPAA